MGISYPGERSNRGCVLIAHAHQLPNGVFQFGDLARKLADLARKLADLAVVRLNRLQQELDPFINRHPESIIRRNFRADSKQLSLHVPDVQSAVFIILHELAWGEALRDSPSFNSHWLTNGFSTR
jgi:hypothetical protein